MAKPRDLIIKYLDEARMMQLATSVKDQPWCCTVYFSVDNLHNIYFISKPDRRHSEEISKNSKVAGVIVKPHTYGEPVRGVQFQGTARKVIDADEIKHLTESYMERYSRYELGEDIATGNNPHCLYQIKPELFVLFDEENFPDNPRQEWKPNA